MLAKETKYRIFVAKGWNICVNCGAQNINERTKVSRGLIVQRNSRIYLVEETTWIQSVVRSREHNDACAALSAFRRVTSACLAFN